MPANQVMPNTDPSAPPGMPTVFDIAASTTKLAIRQARPTGTNNTISTSIEILLTASSTASLSSLGEAPC
ncbi:MAG: hypothetical protein ABIZ52_08225 [Candidatus Limnocylindrales bacterium]